MIRKHVRLRSRNQITLPNEVTGQLHLREGDFLEVVVSDEGAVQMAPARLVKLGTPEAEAAEDRAEQDIQAGRTRGFGSAQELTRHLVDRIRKRHASLKEQMEAFEKEQIRTTLEKTGWKPKQAAEYLGLRPRDLTQKLKRYKLTRLTKA